MDVRWFLCMHNTPFNIWSLISERDRRLMKVEVVILLKWTRRHKWLLQSKLPSSKWFLLKIQRYVFEISFFFQMNNPYTQLRRCLSSIDFLNSFQQIWAYWVQKCWDHYPCAGEGFNFRLQKLDPLTLMILIWEFVWKEGGWRGKGSLKK